MFTLYARDGAGSAAVEALLAELGADFTVADVPKTASGGIPEWFREINPRGEVPALKLPDGTVMTESAAMMIYLADLHQRAGLAPAASAPERPQYLRAIVYLAASAYATDLRMYYPHRYSTEASHAPGIKAQAIHDLNRDFDLFDGWLGEGPFVLGANMSAADIYAAMLISWSEDFGKLTARLPKLKRLYDAVAANPKVRAVWDRNGMP